MLISDILVFLFYCFLNQITIEIARNSVCRVMEYMHRFAAR